MKIALVVFRYFPYGGLERDMLRIAECAARRGHAVTVITTRWEGALPDGIAVEKLKISAWSNHAKMRLFAQNVQSLLEKYDVSVAFNRIPGCDFYFAADDCYGVAMAKKHCRLTLRCLPRYRTFLALEKAIFVPDVKTKILTLTARQKSDYQSTYGTPDERFIALPPGIDPACVRTPDAEDRRAAKREALHLSPQEKMIFLAGSNFHLKGVDRAITAVAALPEAQREMTHFFFAGKSDHRAMMRLAEKLGVDDRVHSLGARKDVADLLLAADLALLLSRNEAAGTFLTEVIAMGCPVIASGACGFAPLVAEAGGGVIPEPFDQPVCNRMIAEFLSTSEARRRKAIAYSGTVDFTRRADAAVDELEKLERR